MSRGKVRTRADVTDIGMEMTPDGWIAHCTVTSAAPKLTIGTFKVGPIKEPTELPAAIGKGLRKFAKGLAGRKIHPEH